MQYTSLKLSKLLAENGCTLESDNWWTETDYGKFVLSLGDIECHLEHEHRDAEKIVPAYDLLWDICVRYAKEFFGENYPKKLWNERIINDPYAPTFFYHHATDSVFYLIQQNKIQEAEDYIWEHCLFNPKNKLTP